MRHGQIEKYIRQRDRVRKHGLHARDGLALEIPQPFREPLVGLQLLQHHSRSPFVRPLANVHHEEYVSEQEQ